MIYALHDLPFQSFIYVKDFKWHLLKKKCSKAKSGYTYVLPCNQGITDSKQKIADINS